MPKSEAKDVPRYHSVAPDDTLDSIAETYGVHRDEILKRNEQRLRDAAQARGVAQHTFRREIRDEQGGSKWEQDYHVFPGEDLEIRDPVEGETGYVK